MLVCAVCEHTGIQGMVINLPCRHSGCESCIVQDSICHLCKQNVVETIPNPLCKEFAPPKIEKLEICEQCPEYVAYHCLGCRKSLCETHILGHAKGQIVEDCNYEPLPPPLMCVRHNKPLTLFTFPNKLSCKDCKVPAHSCTLVKCEKYYRTYIELLIQHAVQITESFGEFLQATRETFNREVGVFEQSIATKKVDELAAFTRINREFEQDCKIFECELMGIEDRLFSLQSVSRLGSSQFMNLVLGYIEPLLSAMGTPPRGIRQSNMVKIPPRMPGFKFSHNRMDGVQKVRLLGLQIAVLNKGKLCCYDFCSKYTYIVPIEERVVDISVCGSKVAILVAGAFYVFESVSMTLVGPTTIDRGAISIIAGKTEVYIARLFRIDSYHPVQPGSVNTSYAHHRSWTSKRDRILHVYQSGELFLIVTKGKKTIFVGANLKVERNVPERVFALRGKAIGAQDFVLGTTNMAVYLKDKVGWYVEPATGKAQKSKIPNLVSVDISTFYPITIWATVNQIHYCFF
jgi:hypothetical protein